MAFSEIEAARVRKAIDAFMRERRPPAHIRSKLDFGTRIVGHSVELFEIRPAFGGKPGEMKEHGIAKTTFVRSRGVWRVFWWRQDLKWHGYEPMPEVTSPDAFFKLVAEDAHACFFG
jgi:hypothetical protein